MKGNFSSQSGNYFAFRPTYPKELYELLYLLVPDTKKAWGCGTGNRKVAQ